MVPCWRWGGGQGLVSIRESQSGAEFARIQTQGPVIGLNFDAENRKLFAIVGSQGDLTRNDFPREMIAFASLESWQRRRDGSWGAAPSRPLPGLFKIMATADGLAGAVLDSNHTSVELIDLQ